MHGLRGFQRDILEALAYFYGVNETPIGKEVRERLLAMGYDDVPRARLYENLDKLVERGLIEKTRADHRANNYVLSQAGRRRFGVYAGRLSHLAAALVEE